MRWNISQWQRHVWSEKCQVRLEGDDRTSFPQPSGSQPIVLVILDGAINLCLRMCPLAVSSCCARFCNLKEQVKDSTWDGKQTSCANVHFYPRSQDCQLVSKALMCWKFTLCFSWLHSVLAFLKQCQSGGKFQGKELHCLVI